MKVKPIKYHVVSLRILDEIFQRVHKLIDFYGLSLSELCTLLLYIGLESVERALRDYEGSDLD